MEKKKILSSVLAGGMVLTTLAAPALAATDVPAVIDENRDGTLNIHKIVENDSQNVEAYGLANPDEHRIPVNNIRFDYVKIADIQNIRGIVVSEDGAIDWDADNGQVSVGAYYVPTALMEGLIEAAGIEPEAVYIKTSVVGDPATYPTIQYEYDDQGHDNFLVAEQAAVDAAKADLEAKKAAYIAARRDYNLANSNQNETSKNLAQLNEDLAAAQAEQTAAATALSEANTAANAAAEAFSQASTNAGAAASAAQEKANALATAKGQYNVDNAAYNDAIAAAQTAANEFREAENLFAQASAKKAEANERYAQAQAAQAAAADILSQVEAIAPGALGTQDSLTGVANALAYAQEQLDNADAYLEQAEDLNDEAEDLFDEATAHQTAAQQAMEAADTAEANAKTANDNSYDAFVAAQNESNAANQAKDEADAALEQAQADKDAADAAKAAAQARKDAADAKVAELQTAVHNAELANQAGNTDVSGKEATMNTAKAAYDASLAAYNTALETLNTTAANGGVIIAYTAESVQGMMEKLLTTMTESEINEWVKENSQAPQEANATDDHGVVCFSGMDLGLYMVAETDDSYHDGKAGAWNDDPNGGFINNDQRNSYDQAGENGTYTIGAIDDTYRTGDTTNFSPDSVTRTYEYGDWYRESVNPEFPVIENPAAPFLVSLPTTNSIDTTEDMVAAGDNYGEAGTVWQYTVDVYPKNQTTSIFKRIIDPDENLGSSSLRTSEDFQEGDTFSTMIWAESPGLQPNYLNTDQTNTHHAFVLSDKMDEGYSLSEGSIKVHIIPASQLKGENIDTVYTYYVDGNGERLTEAQYAALDDEEFPVNPETGLRQTIRYFDDNGVEITKEEYEAKSGRTDGSDANYKVEYSDFKKVTGFGDRFTADQALNENQLGIVYDASEEEGITLEEGTDYEVIITDENRVVIEDTDGNFEEVIPSGQHGFAIRLLPAGLAKLDERGDSYVVCQFDCILNSKAKIGQTPMNMNYATLDYVNSNTSFKRIRSNEVYAYSYELQLVKQGVDEDAMDQVKFVIKRTDANDVNQSDDKDLTDTVSSVTSFGQDDSMAFVMEEPGVYHVWTAEDGMDGGVPNGERTTLSLNGEDKTFYTVTPGPGGLLKIYGLDSDSYTFKEVQTQAGKNLLKDTFTVNIKAMDDELDSLRDGRIAEATVTTGNSDPIDITIGVTGTDGRDTMGDANNLGIAALAVNNYSVVDLRTGGAGRTMIYIVGAGLLGLMGVGALIVGKRKKADEE